METEWKKDEKPYIIFTCSKCQQYGYVKTTQKTKKCLRCGHTHQVKNIRVKELVRGMSTAVLAVKERQNELAIKELGIEPELRGQNDFCVSDNQIKVQNQEKEKIDVKNLEDDYYLEKFREILIHLAKMHKLIPIYLIKFLKGVTIAIMQFFKFIGTSLIHTFARLKTLSKRKTKINRRDFWRNSGCVFYRNSFYSSNH